VVVIVGMRINVMSGVRTDVMFDVKITPKIHVIIGVMFDVKSGVRIDVRLMS
jgi:hypothetical protein